MLKLTAIALAAATLTTAAGAQTAATHPAAKPVATTKTTVATHTASRTMTTRPAMVTTSGKMATTTTKTGKKITYDCSKKGNMNKTACKR